MKGSQGNRSQMKQQATADADTAQQFAGSVDDWVNKIFRQGIAPKDAIGVSSQFLEGVYAQAYRLYNTGKYTEASHLFRMLILMDPTEAKYVLGLAACFHMLKEYKNAVQTYTMYGILDPTTPLPHYHSSDCFIQMKDYPSAFVCLKMAIKYAGDRPEYAKLKERAQLSLESIKEQINSEPSTTE
jgi:type III secretion system low calcium response chaperone LcrH/SycD